MRRRQSPANLVVVMLILTGIWSLLSGKFDLLHFGLGVVTAAVIAFTIVPVEDRSDFRMIGFVVYVPWLVGQIVLSNLRVARLVLSPRMPIRPAFVSQRPGVTGPRALTTLACSVTLTPGTLTIDVGEDEIFVHALDAVSAQDVRDQVTSRRVSRVFQETG